MSLEGTVRAQTPLRREPLTEASFLEDLCRFMANRGTPIERIPHLGFKRLDLFLMFKIVQEFGGFDRVTAFQQWKQVYNVLGGNPQSTSAATCTRRHYEKLLLPYECHLKQDQDTAMTPTQPQKRSHHDSFPLEEKEGPRGKKFRAGNRILNPTLAQRSCDLLPERGIKSMPKPVQHQPYLNISLPDLPACLPVSPNMPPRPNTHPQVHPQPHPPPSTHPPCSFAHPVVSDGLKQQLVKPQQLEKEHPTSPGREEPLNLSLRQGGVDTVRQPQSSCNSLENNNKPKFLNRVSSLYSDWSMIKEKECMLPRAAAAATGAGLTQPHTRSPGVQEQPVIDLTSSRDISPARSSTTETNLGSSPPLGCSLKPQNLMVKGIQGRNLKPSPIGEVEGPLKLSYAHSRLDLPTASTGKMQTETPGVPLQGSFKFLQHRPGTVDVKANGDLVMAGEKQWFRQAADKLPMTHTPSDLSFLLPNRDGRITLGEPAHWKSVMKRHGSLTYPVAQEHHLGGHHYLTSQSHHPDSLASKPCNSQSAPKHCGDTTRPLPGAFYGIPDIGDVNRQLSPWWKDPEAQRLFHMGRLYSLELQAGRGHPDAQPTSSMQFPSATHNPEAPHCRLGPTGASGLLKGIPAAVTGPPSFLKGNLPSSPLLSITPEEYTSLRRLVYSSP
ncbi:uncharacterized protein LOC118777037 [Megalops cyprinoides]|uniref:uncharacterized protein LOC118777037 n=1 Tax=Megalops cyprinoides TaxID=118141 RepID=UPI001864B763|nr:uncharacterized protein LOC118777037 [Megalops cyprinoides]